MGTLEGNHKNGDDVKTIITTCGSFLTGNEIADAVTDYGLALARARELDVIEIPFVADDGSRRRARMRIGWLIETVITSDASASDEVTERDTIRDLTAKSRVLTGRAEAVDSDDDGQGWLATSWDELI